MIDDKKIEAIAEKSFENKFTDCGEMVDEGDIKEAIALGIKLGINEFLRDLWHPASEEPVEDKPFLAKQIGRWRVDVNSSLFPNNVWSTHCKIQGIKRWLYVEDLLPKTQKGGYHD